MSNFGTPPPSGPGGFPTGGTPTGAPFGAPPTGPQVPANAGPQGPRLDTMAVVALVLGILGLLLGLTSGVTMMFGAACCVICVAGSSVFSIGSVLLGLAAAIVGGLSVKRIKDDPVGLRGRELAIAGIVLGVLAGLVGLVTLVLPLLGIGLAAAAQSGNLPSNFGR